jgi:hypothetical protein
MAAEAVPTEGVNTPPNIGIRKIESKTMACRCKIQSPLNER